MLRTLSIPRVFIEEDDVEYQVYEKNTSEIDEEQEEDDSEFDNTESLGEIALKLIGLKGGNKNTRKIKKKTTRKKSRKK